MFAPPTRLTSRIASHVVLTLPHIRLLWRAAARLISPQPRRARANHRAIRHTHTRPAPHTHARKLASGVRARLVAGCVAGRAVALHLKRDSASHAHPSIHPHTHTHGLHSCCGPWLAYRRALCILPRRHCGFNVRYNWSWTGIETQMMTETH